MNRKLNHQNLLRTALTTAGTNMTRWAVTLALVMITMFALPTGAWAQDPATSENGTSQAGVVENGYNTGEVGQNGGGSGISGYYIPFTIALYANGQITENNAVGTASSDPAYVERDHIEITITATANPGYKFREWQSKSTGISFTVNDNKNATYSFTHPGGTNVSFTAVFEVDPDYQGGNGEGGQTQIVKVTEISLLAPENFSSITNEGQSYQFGANVLPENASYKSVKWSVADGCDATYSDQTKCTYAEISENGLLKLNSVGNVTIFAAATDDSGFYASMNIFIFESTPSKFTVAGAGGKTSVAVGGSLQMEATVVFPNGADNSVTWSIRNIDNNGNIEDSGNARASIDLDGLLTGIAPGKVRVFATSNFKNNFDSSCDITITDGESGEDGGTSQSTQGGEGGGGEIGEGGQGQTTNYTLSFEANYENSGGTMIPIIQSAGSKWTIPACSFKRTNYTFIGWATSAEGGVEYQKGDKITAEADMTLYAKWTPNPTVTFYANDGTETMTSVRPAYDKEYTIPKCTFSNGDLAFLGWATWANGDVAYQPGDKITLTADMTLYAKWQASSGTFGQLTWSVTKSAGSVEYDVLTISGSGGMSYSTEYPWSVYQNLIKTIVIEYGVTSIGNYAFYDFPNVTSLSIGNSVQTIEASAFVLYNLTSDIILPASLTSLGNSAFIGVASKTANGISITAAEGSQLASISSTAFGGSVSKAVIDLSNCTKLETIDGEQTFLGTQDVTLPHTVTSIAQYAFGKNDFFSGEHVYIVVPEGHVLTVNGEPYNGTLTDGKADLIPYLFDNPGKRAPSNALTLAMEKAVAPVSGTYQLSGDYVSFYDKETNPITEAAVGETVIVSYNPYDPEDDSKVIIPSGKYFTGRYTATEGVTVTMKGARDGTFIMPAKNVSVSAVLADQEEYTLNMTTTKPQVIPRSVWLLLNCLDDNYVYDDETQELFLELNGDGKRDVQLKQDYNETTEVSTYSVIRQPGADAITENLRFSFSWDNIDPQQYNSVLFLFKPQAIQSDWITVGDGTPLVYNGQAQTPAVVVKDGTTTLSAETDYEVTYSNNMNACEATAENAPTVTVTAKATSMSYTGTATATFTIAPKVVTSPTITLSATSAAYDGSDLTPTVTAVKDGETTIAHTEYIVSYKKGSEAVEKCIEPGEYTVVISDGEGGNYTVSGTATFTITKEAIDAVIHLINDIGTVEYTEEGKTKIDAAREAYDALNDAQQKLVTNYAMLTAAETTYAELKAEAEAQAAVELAAKQKAFEERIKAEGYSDTYDGLTHKITVTAPEEATVKYGTEEGQYGSDNPLFKDAGTYTVYYEVSMESLTSVTGSAEVKISRKALSLVADPVTITEGEALPTTFTGSITGFVTGEGLGDTDVLAFSLDNPGASAAGSFSITGTLNSATSGDYGQNYTFANAASNATALTINAKPTPDPTPEPTPTPIPTPEPAPEPAPDVIVFEAVQDNDATKELKKAISDAQDNNAIMDLLPENIQSQLPEDVTSVEAIQTFKLGNYQESMGNVTVKASFQTPLEAGVDVTFVIALPGNDGEVAWYALGGTVNENGDVLVTLEKSIAIAINNQVFVAMVMVGGSPSGTITPTPTPTEAKITIGTPEDLAVNDEFTATIGETEYAPNKVNIDYTLLMMNGITVDATLSATLVSSTGNKATYRVTGNKATKLTFGSVEWKGTSALMTRPANISFSGADVDTSKLRFTNIQSLEANKKMTLVSDFGESVGTITGSKYGVGTSLEGEGGASLDGSDLRFKTRTATGQTAQQEQTHNTVMGAMTSNCAISFRDCHVSLDAEGLALSSSVGADGVATFAKLGGGSVRQETGCRRMARGVSAERPFFSISYSGARIMCKAEDVALRAAEAQGNTRSVEQDITIESGKTYDIMTDEDLVLTLKLSEGDILITSITLIMPEDPDPNDLNLDGKVNAVDLVKAISDGKTQAEIDEIVNSIMNKE